MNNIAWICGWSIKKFIRKGLLAPPILNLDSQLKTGTFCICFSQGLISGGMVVTERKGETMFGLRFGKRKIDGTSMAQAQLAQKGRIIKPHHSREKGAASLKSNQAQNNFPGDYGFHERISLYRFLRDNIPIINGAIWVWVRLCSSPIEFYLRDSGNQRNTAVLKAHVDELNRRLAPNPYYKSGGLERLSDLFFNSLFIDGAFAGNIEIDESGKFIVFSPCDIRNLSFEFDSGLKIYHDTGNERVLLDPATFVYIPLDDDPTDPRGKSILQSVGFVSRLEQKLLDDMQKSQEKAGYNRLHVLIKKPEKRLGETENAFIDRAYEYFDDTVTLFSGIRPSDSAVTWDDIEIKTIGPASGAGSATHSWYLSHRALVEDICAGIHLDPFMLGYSYSSTQTWARFKYELVLREIISVQRLAARFFEWLMNSHLALSGITFNVSARFDNNRVNSALEHYRAEHEASDRVMELFKAGLLSKEEAREKIFRDERIN